MRLAREVCKDAEAEWAPTKLIVSSTPATPAFAAMPAPSRQDTCLRSKPLLSYPVV